MEPDIIVLDSQEFNARPDKCQDTVPDEEGVNWQQTDTTRTD